MEKLSVELIKELLDILRSAKEFVLAQAPEVIQELYRWMFWTNVVGIGLGLILLVLTWIAVRWFRRHWGEVYSKDLEGLVLLLLLPFVGGVLFISNCAPDLIKLCLAPRLYLIDYLMGLVK